MCTVCGCSGHQDPATPPLTLDFGQGPAGTHLPGVTQTRTITLEKNILDANNAIARRNRQHFVSHGVRAINLLSSPGSGKTTLLCKTLDWLKTTVPAVGLSVIEGDQQTSMDAERIRETGVSVVQVNTGKGCHLDAQMIEAAFGKLHRHPESDVSLKPSANLSSQTALAEMTFRPPQPDQLLFIENVGNLVCPALWDLGEAHKVVILSVTEGEDKPLKYPDMFRVADLLLINKIDLLPYVTFDPAHAIEAARRINPDLDVIEVSATTGEGLSAWVNWLLSGETKGTDPSDHEALMRQIERLEMELASLRRHASTAT